MARFLINATYTAEGAKGLQKDGGSKRRKAAQALVESLGGKMEGFYFAFGDADAIVIVDMPDTASAAAASVAIASTGLVSSRTTVLMTAEEMDQALSKSPSYTAPGR